MNTIRIRVPPELKKKIDEYDRLFKKNNFNLNNPNLMKFIDSLIPHPSELKLDNFFRDLKKNGRRRRFLL